MHATRRRRWKRVAAALACGGCLLQFGGCLTAAAPVLLSLGESTLLTYLFGLGFGR